MSKASEKQMEKIQHLWHKKIIHVGQRPLGGPRASPTPQICQCVVDQHQLFTDCSIVKNISLNLNKTHIKTFRKIVILEFSILTHWLTAHTDTVTAALRIEKKQEQSDYYPNIDCKQLEIYLYSFNLCLKCLFQIWICRFIGLKT